MRSVLQRVSSARVCIAGQEHARIGFGWFALVGIEDSDTTDDIEWLSGKIVDLRVFENPSPASTADNPVASRVESIVEVRGEILVVSQFTLMASTRKGTRPSWHRAAKPAVAQPLYEAFIRRLADRLGRPIATGVFGAEMDIELTNNGPVTLWLDSKSRE